MSDTGTPILTSLVIKAPWLADLAAFVGEIARPFAIITIGGACAWAILDKDVDATKLGVALTGLAALYGGKVAEKIVQARADADVKKANSGA